MKIKLVPIMAVMLLASTALLAQPRELNYTEVCEHIGNCLIKNYHPDSITLAKTCRRGCIFIKFKVNKQGKISDLAFSKDSTAFITAALQKAINSLQDDITLINALKGSGKTVIQPFIYMYQAGCNFPHINVISATTAERLNFYHNYLMTWWEMDHIDDALLDMLNFKDGKLLALDGILLSPIQVGAGGVE